MSNQNGPSPLVLLASAVVTLIGMAPAFINIMVRRAQEAKSKKPDVKAPEVKPTAPALKVAQDIEQQLPQGRPRNQPSTIAADVRLGREIASDNQAPKAEAPKAKKPVGKKPVGKKSVGKKAGKPETPQP